VELRVRARLQVRFAELLALFVTRPERVVVLDPAELILDMGLEVPVRELF
jgi:hypothetical protein